MRIILIGANGTVGSKVFAELSKKHEVITAGRNSGSLKVDIADPDSIEAMYKTAGRFDAVVVAAGSAKMAPLQEMTGNDFLSGIHSKLMGQINVVLSGQHQINAGGSFTLISGILAEDPIQNGTSLSVVNGAINSFVIAAANELKNDVRINVVSPGLVEDSYEALGEYFPGHNPAPMDRVVKAFVKSVEGVRT